MLIPDFLAARREPFFSFELIPPERGGGIQGVFEQVDLLLPHRPAWIDVTNHAADARFEELPDGSWRRHVYRKRPGTLGLCAAIKSRTGVETVPHLLCLGFTREETEDALIELSYLDIRNVLAVRGDQVASGLARPGARNEHAIDLVRQIAAMNRGRYLQDLAGARPTEFAVGVAGYPERHFESPNGRYDLERLKEKVDAGAQWIVTQMVFSAAAYRGFVGRCREAGIEVPVVPGLKVVQRRSQLSSLPRHFHVELPEALTEDLQLAGDAAARREVGIAHAAALGRELLEAGAPGLHFFVTQDAELVSLALRRCGL
jgi:methylenetetrahydrofolate reductase (NADPH)